MWTVFHFACYYGHCDVLKYFINQVGVSNPLISLTKNPAMNEIEETFTLGYEDDKIYGLILAFQNRQLEVFEYLLRELSPYWPKMTIPYLLQYYRSPSDYQPNFEYLENVYEGVATLPSERFSKEVWVEAISPLMRSDTAHIHYLNLSYNDKRIFIYETMRDISEQPENQQSEPGQKSVKQLFIEEFIRPPYAGVFQYYLAFEDKESSHEMLAEAYQNSNKKYDWCEYLIYEDLVDVEIDINYEAEAMEGIRAKNWSIVKNMFEDLRTYQETANDALESIKINILQAWKEGNLELLKDLIEQGQYKPYTDGIEKFKGLEVEDTFIK